MPTQPRSPAQRRAKHYVTRGASQETKFFLRQFRQTVLSSSGPKQIDRSEVNHWGFHQRCPPWAAASSACPNPLQAGGRLGKGADASWRDACECWAGLCQTRSYTPRNGQSRRCGVSETTIKKDTGHPVTVSESGFQTTRENNLEEKQHHARDNRLEEGLKSQCKLHASRYQFALQPSLGFLKLNYAYNSLIIHSGIFI